MATGKTHDAFTWAMAPLVWCIAQFGLHYSISRCLLITIGTLIGGLLLSPDLDTRSRPFYRWGLFRFIWWPYQWMIRHRSGWSHGILLASWLRLIYLSAVLSLFYCLTCSAVTHWLRLPAHAPGQDIVSFIKIHLSQIFWFGVGLWVGALLHIVLDYLSSYCFSRRRHR